MYVLPLQYVRIRGVISIIIHSITCTLLICINTCFNALQSKIPCGKKLWQIGTQNMFGRESIGGLSIYTEGIKRLADKTLMN